MHTKGLLIFDLDGTLLDSMDLHASMFAKILGEQYGVADNISREAYYRMSGIPLGLQFKGVLESQGVGRTHRIDENVQDFYARIRQFDPPLFPDVQPALQQLWQAGYWLVVCSGNAPDIVEKRLAHTGIKPYFRLWLGTDPAQGLRKGEPHFQILRESLSLSAVEFRENSMSVGDAQHDVEVARQAGILSVGRQNPFNAVSLQSANPDYLISDFNELLQILHDSTGAGAGFCDIAFLKKELL
jgi:phosphoglycolate phosphatase